MVGRGWLALAVLPALLTGPALAEEEHPVRAELVVDRSAAVPTETLQVGIRLQMAPGWHLYWRNPGDSGMPPAIEWELPPGVTAGEVQWPIPHRLEEAGGLVVYGYTDEVVLLTTLMLPARAPDTDSLQLAARVEWLVCQDLCLPGEARLSLSLPWAEGGEAKHQALFTHWAARIPRPWPDGTEVDVEPQSTGEYTVRISWPTELDPAQGCFPAGPDGEEVGAELLGTAEPGQLRLRITGSAGASIRLVLDVGDTPLWGMVTLP